MKKKKFKIKAVIGIIIAVLIALWIVDKIPFSRNIDQTVSADIYKDGSVIGETSVYMNGTKTRYLFREDSFVGEFRIFSVEQTNIDELETKIAWQKDSDFRRISHFYKGEFSPADERGIADYMLISADMKDFAVLTAEQEIIATSEKAYQLCADHLSYKGDGKMTAADKPAHGSPEKLGDYLYYMECSDFVPEIAGDLAPIEAKGGCSTVRNGSFFGRNLDMNYCECAEFVIRMNASQDRYASIGLSANPYITANIAEMTEDELLRIPTITNDGINENGVLASVHVVLSDGIDDQSGTNAGGEVIDGRYVVRYVLDHARSAEHAVSLLEKANIVGGFGQYGLHWMIADEKDTYVVEVIGGKLSVSKNEYNCMTNFYLNYGPVQEAQTVGGTTFEDLPLLNERAIGVERWAYLRDHYAESNTAEGMEKLMKSVKATTVYTQDEDDLWLTEHSSDGLTIRSTREDFLRVAAQQQEMYEHRDRSNPQGDWITWHTSVYDIAKAKLTVWSQEDYTASYEFTLQ